MATFYFVYEDELEIVGEATMDDNIEEDHLGILWLLYRFAPLLNIRGFQELGG